MPKAGICFEALEPRLLLSGSWGAVVDGPSADSQADTRGGLLTQGSVVFHADIGNTAALNGRVQLTPESGRVDLLSRAPVLNTFGNAVSALDASSASILVRARHRHATALSLADSKDVVSNPESHSDSVDAAVRRELVFVNDDVDAYEILINGIRESDANRTVEIVVLDADRDGIQQVSDILAERSDLSAVHVIAHGSDGQINLGNSWLNSATLEENSDAVAGWGNALNETGDILFYGCNIAADSYGQRLLANIAELTGADVAASDDATGHTSLDGDWELEQLSGAVETQVIVGTELRGDWTVTLNVEKVQATYVEMPLAFEQNVGQTDTAVDFLSRGDGYSVFLTDGDAVLKLRGSGNQHVVRLDLVGANTDLNVTGQDHLASRSNYLIGNDESSWQTNVDSFASVYYKNVYEGIDLRYYGNQRQLEYDFVVDPGSDPDAIRLQFEGIVDAEIGASGELRLILNEQGEATTFKAPISYQTADDGSRIAVTSTYVIHDDGSIGFALGDYDSTRELVIDPILDYTTFVGGIGYDTAAGIAADDSGNVNITGYCASTDFPTTAGAYDEIFTGGSYDFYVSKLSADGSTLLYTTFIGGTGSDIGESIAVDASGNVYLAGMTTSTDLATVNAYQSSLGGTSDAFLLKLNSTGDALLYSSYFGGASGSETAYDIALDGANNVYVTGQTNSADLPLMNAYDSILGGTEDAFVAKFDLSQAGASSLLYSTFFGGSSTGYANSIVVDHTGAFTITGRTNSTDLPTQNAYQAANGGGTDVYVTRFDSTGSTVTYSTYLGGINTEYADGACRRCERQPLRGRICLCRLPNHDGCL